MRHALGVLGVLAAGVLLAVSAAMNWRFGYGLGRSELDGQILGAASAAADCLKALIPFFFFAALRNRMWSQAAAALVVGVVVTGYSLASALGFASTQRSETAGQHQADAQVYKDLRATLKHSQDELGWIPPHRPAVSIQSDLDSLKNQRAWGWTNGCKEPGTDKSGIKFCDRYLSFASELASAQKSLVTEATIAELQGKLGKMSGAAVMSESDPQAKALSDITGLDISRVQTVMAIFVALLLEIGSTLGLYIAFSQWDIRETHPRPATKPVAVDTHIAAVAVAAPAAVAIEAKPRPVANDNKVAPAQRMMAPENDVERYYKEKIETRDGSTVTATEMYEDYCSWCEAKEKEPLALPTFGRQFGDLGVQKSRIAGRTRYIGISVKSSTSLTEDKNQPAFSVKAA